MQGLRKLLRAIAIMTFTAVSCWLLVDAAMNGPGEYQLAMAAILMLGAVVLVATWFWSPL